MARVVAVFGGSGFIGDYVIRELEGRGEQPCIVDAATPEKTVGNVMRDATHVMWLVPPVPGLVSERVRVIAASPRLAKFFYASTVLLYGDSGSPQREEAPLQPLTDYERAKYDEESVVCGIFSGCPEKLVIARFANVYGGTKSKGVIGKMFASLKGKSIFVMNGDGSQRRDYIHVADVARLATDLLLAPEAIGTFNVSTGIAHSLREVLHTIENIAGEKMHVKRGKPVAEKRTIAADPAKLHALLGDASVRPLDEGLRETYEQYVR